MLSRTGTSLSMNNFHPEKKRVTFNCDVSLSLNFKFVRLEYKVFILFYLLTWVINLEFDKSLKKQWLFATFF
jgi:hypothetical protein